MVALQLCFYLMIIGLVSNAQPTRVIRANATTADILDGNNFRQGHWTIMPEVNPDVYYVQRSKAPKRVVFYTDIDSIAFEVAPGDEYNFVILLRGKDSCYTRISTLRKSYYKDCEACPITRDTIPFILKSDNKVHITGSINGSAPLDFLFDTGADHTVLYKNGAKKVQLFFDGKIQNVGFGGIQTRDLSQRNQLTLGNMKWKDEAVMFIDNQADNADGIIGFNVFEDKLVEIDYERQQIIIHDRTFDPGTGYAKFPIRYKGTLPQIRATLNTGLAVYADDFIFDMGAKGSLFLPQSYWTGKGFENLRSIGKHTSRGVGGAKIKSNFVVLPELTLGTYSLVDLPIDLALSPAEGLIAGNLLGMDVLKRFNTIIDYQRHIIYLKPNKLLNASYLSGDSDSYLWWGAGLLLCLLAGIYLVLRKKKLKYRLAANNRKKDRQNSDHQITPTI